MRLEFINNVTISQRGVIILETSGKSRLLAKYCSVSKLQSNFQNSRQSCAIESAALRSGLAVTVVMTAEMLDLEDNTTCELYRANYHNIHFYTVDIAKLAKKTPLGRVQFLIIITGLLVRIFLPRVSFQEEQEFRGSSL